MDLERIDTELERIQTWKSNEANGWATTEVAARFEAGARGEINTECVRFGPKLTSACCHCDSYPGVVGGAEAKGGANATDGMNSSGSSSPYPLSVSESFSPIRITKAVMAAYRTILWWGVPTPRRSWRIVIAIIGTMIRPFGS